MNIQKHDSLTGLITKIAFREYITDAIEEHERLNSCFAITFIDIDNFKSFNDREGHLLGDELIKQISEILKNNVRNGDLICRYGGDEFIILFPHTNAEVAFILLEDIRKLIDETEFILKIQEKTIKTRATLSMGIASFPRDAKTDVEMLRKSDEALYRAKLEGRNSVRLSLIEERMKSKTNFYSSHQLERLSIIAKETKKSESFLLREALDDLITKYTDLKQRENTLLELQMGKDLLNLVDPGKGGELLEEIGIIRKEFEHELGVILPGVRCRDNLALKPTEFIVKIRDNEVTRIEVSGYNEKTKEEIGKCLRQVFRDNITRL